MYNVVILAKNESFVIYENLNETNFEISMDDLKSDRFNYSDDDAGMSIQMYVQACSDYGSFDSEVDETIVI